MAKFGIGSKVRGRNDADIESIQDKKGVVKARVNSAIPGPSGVYEPSYAVHFDGPVKVTQVVSESSIVAA